MHETWGGKAHGASLSEFELRTPRTRASSHEVSWVDALVRDLVADGRTEKTVHAVRRAKTSLAEDLVWLGWPRKSISSSSRSAKLLDQHRLVLQGRVSWSRFAMPDQDRAFLYVQYLHGWAQVRIGPCAPACTSAEVSFVALGLVEKIRKV